MKKRIHLAHYMKILLSILLLFPAVMTLAQDDDDLPPADGTVREKIQAVRIAYITNQLALTPEEAEKFWPIYREFTEKRQQIQRRYREAKRNPDPSKTQEQNDTELVTLDLTVKQQELDLEKDYSARLLKVIPAHKLKALPDVERRFRQMVLNQIRRRQMQPERREQLRERSKE